MAHSDVLEKMQSIDYVGAFPVDRSRLQAARPVGLSELPPGVSIHDRGEGLLGPIVRGKDWSTTSVGPIEEWPETLKGYVGMILSMPSPAIIFWGEDQVQIYNDGYSHIMGPRHPKYLGATYKECWPDTYPTIYPWMRRVLQHGEVVTVDRTLIPLTRYGFTEEAFFTFSFTPLRDDSGKIAGILQIVTEMTEAMLSERRTDTLRRLAPGPETYREGLLGVADALSLNPNDIRFAQIFVPKGEDYKLSLEASFNRPETDEQNQMRRLVEEAYVSNSTREIKNTNNDAPQLAQGAVVLPIRLSETEQPRGVVALGISPKLRFDEKYRNFFNAVAREIAAKLLAAQERRTQAALKAATRSAEREREKLHSLFMQAPISICILDGPEHVYTLANPRYNRLVGHREILGKTIRQALPELEGQGIYEILDQVYQEGKTFAGDLKTNLLQPDGDLKECYFNLIYQPWLDANDRVGGIFVVANDITEEVASRKKVEQAVQIRDEFMSVASHELKTPLTSLRIQTQLRKRHVSMGNHGAFTIEKISKMLESDDRQITRLTRLIDDMLDISRINSGRLTVTPEPVELVSIVNEVAERFTEQLTNAGCELSLKTCEKAAGHWDRYRIEQVVANLFTNALRYGAGKPVEVSVETKDKKAVLTVRDHGIGVAKEDQERIFKQFERAISTNEVSGLGLGLYIVSQILEAHKGTIRVDSTPGKGAAFTVELPLSS